MSAIRAIISRTNPLGTTLLLYGDDLIDDNNELVSAVELPADVFEHLLAFSRGNQEIRAVINYSDDSSIKIYDYADTIVTDEDGVQGIILEDTGIILYSGTQPTIGEDILPFIVTGGGGGGSDLPDVTSADNGNVLTVVNGAWDKASAPTELPAVSGSDNGKVLTVYNGAWAKRSPSSPSNAMLVKKLELSDWGTDYVLVSQVQGESVGQYSFTPEPDVIEIRTYDDSVKTAFSLGEYRRYYLNDVPEDYENVSWKSIDGQHSIVIDLTSEATTITIEGFTFTFLTGTYANDFWSCHHN